MNLQLRRDLVKGNQSTLKTINYPIWGLKNVHIEDS